MMKLNYFLYGLLWCISSSTNNISVINNDSIRLKTEQQNFTAGTTIVLTFSGSEDASIRLYCSNSYGTTLLNPKVITNELQYILPAHISNKAGVVQWKLLNNASSLSGIVHIVPQEQPVSLETYVGPPSIEAGKTDYTMLVTIPTDTFDNPLPENTKVTLRRQFLSSEQQDTIKTSNLIAYQNMYAPIKSGRMLLATECLNLNSKEYTVEIMPAIATDFEIFSKRSHEYADGNQLTTFTTSILKDKYGNIVSDGTYVEFIIKNAHGNLLKTAGMTIDGVATAQMMHPDHEETWKIKAYVTGISESNTLSLTYKQVVKDFTVSFSKNNRNIEVGPLQSFMKQHIPDGLQVMLHISQNGNVVKSDLKESRNGFVNFELNPNVISNGKYDIHITAAGITKIFKEIQL